ncbi:Polyphosphate kinase 2, PPK2 family [Psychrobacillus sp. OK028]|uniref:polyphosphate kinase 2 family protein n=1 Tax=Psychrobacillus sp. OK028 TaxID=1884359 RepID=UPI00087FDF79|nr:polyphosphate kinase [Psychrobacillus sp. OK028]SDN13847.1 Polyphosphate kinase 2, PPK2 family [Psychrobacillus sp. OK028]
MLKNRLNNLEATHFEHSKKEYKKILKQLQYHLLSLQQTLLEEKIGLILAFEGMDAAGKGGAIKRLTQRLDPRGYIVHPISAPQPHELRYHYLQRFWRKLPQHGQIGIFDRSWYGRVLVERVEKLATKEEWKRAYKEINQFEKTLSAENYIVIKHWIHVSEEEQLKRFIERKTDPYKMWKLTDEDWRNREKYGQYLEAAEDMFSKTNCTDAPWFIVHGDDKLHARLVVLQNIIQEIEDQLDKRGIEYTPITEEVKEDKVEVQEMQGDE